MENKEPVKSEEVMSLILNACSVLGEAHSILEKGSKDEDKKCTSLLEKNAELLEKFYSETEDDKE